MPGLSINHYMTPPGYPLERFLDDCVAAGATGIGLTERALDEVAVPVLRRLLGERDLRVTSVNSAGFFLWGDPAQAARQKVVNAALIDAAAELGATTLVTILGGLHDCGPERPGALERARRDAAEALPSLVEAASARGVRLGVEAMHPLRLASKSVLSSLRQAEALCAGDDRLGIVLDAFHVWWDPELVPMLERLAPRIALVQISGVTLSADGTKPQTRCELREGVADIGALLRDLRRCGYSGEYELEIFAEDMGRRACADVIRRAVDDFTNLADA